MRARGIVELGVVVLFAGGCFSPTPPAGAPCDVELANCPRGLACYAVGSESRCLPAPPDTDALAPGDDASVADMAVDATMTLTYPATVAECVDPSNPSPMNCRAANGNASLRVDADDPSTNSPWLGFIRFDLDGSLAGANVLSVILVARSTSAASAASVDSGVVWRVEPFTATSLIGSVPPRVGAVPVAQSQGAVVANQTVEWPLPISLANPNNGLYLSLVNPTADGVEYMNTSGAMPPQLVVVVAP